MNLVFDAVTGFFQPVSFSFADPLPNVIGRHQIAFDWSVLDPADPSQRPRRQHRPCRLHHMEGDGTNSAQRLLPWASARLVEWTSKWAAGCDGEKAMWMRS